MVSCLGRSLGFAQDSKPTVEILEAETTEHRIGDRGPLYTNLGNQHFAAACEVVVGTDGKVVSVQVSNGFFGDLTLLCKTWQYKWKLRLTGCRSLQMDQTQVR